MGGGVNEEWSLLDLESRKEDFKSSLSILVSIASKWRR